MHGGTSRHMACDNSLINGIQEKEGGMSVELGATYPMRGVGYFFFQMDLGDLSR